MLIEVDLTLNIYDVFVTPESTNEKIKIATDYAFRSDQSAIEKMNGFVIKSSEGSYKLKNFCLNDECSEGSLSIVENEIIDVNFKSYPNPFTESTSIKFKQTESSFISIDIYIVWMEDC